MGDTPEKQQLNTMDVGERLHRNQRMEADTTHSFSHGTMCDWSRRSGKRNPTKYLSQRLRNTCGEKLGEKVRVYKLVRANATTQDALSTCHTLSVQPSGRLTRANRPHFASRLQRAQQRDSFTACPHGGGPSPGLIKDRAASTATSGAW